MIDQTHKVLYFILGKRKAGTTYLFHALDTEFKPEGKDLSWDETKTDIKLFMESEARTGVIAKADAIYHIEDAIREIRQTNITISDIHFLVLDRDPYERFLSYLGHERKLKWRPITIELCNFELEEKSALEGIQALQENNCIFERLRYEDLSKISVKGIDTKPVNSIRNSRHQNLPFFSVISFLTSNRYYRSARNSILVSSLKDIYYRRLAKDFGTRNGFINCILLGSINGPIDGQRRITKTFATNTSLKCTPIDFDGHRGWFGSFKLLSQLIKVLFISTTNKLDVVYIALSRTKFGLLRDCLLLFPLTLKKPKLVAHIHGAEFEGFFYNEPSLRTLKQWVLGKVDSFIFLHEALVPAQLKANKRVITIPNPIPAFCPDICSRKNEDISSTLCIGFISSFVPGKGIETFLKLANIRYSNTKFYVAGGTHPKFNDYGLSILAKLEETPNVEYMGYLKAPEEFYQSIDILIFPTEYVSEALPGVLIESLAFGCLPVVKKSNFLPEIFAQSPIFWFENEYELHHCFDELLKLDNFILNSRKEQCADWVNRHFPTKNDWLLKIESTLLGWQNSN